MIFCFRIFGCKAIGRGGYEKSCLENFKRCIFDFKPLFAFTLYFIHENKLKRIWGKIRKDKGIIKAVVYTTACLS